MSDRMIRKQIYIHKWQDSLLKGMAKQRGVSEAEVIRQALEREAAENESAELVQGQALQTLIGFARALRERPEFQRGDPYNWDRRELYADREQSRIKPQKKKGNKS